MSGVDVAEAPREVSDRRRRVRRSIAGFCAAVVVAAVIAGVIFWHWQHGLHLFGDGGDGVGGPIAVGRIEFVMATDGSDVHGAATSHVIIDVRSATPRVIVNSARATISVLQCSTNGATTILGAAPSHPYCGRAEAFTPGPHRFSTAPGGTAFLIAITAHRPGRVQIDGIDVTYDDGIRHGAQNIGLDMVFHAAH